MPSQPAAASFSFPVAALALAFLETTHGTSTLAPNYDDNEDPENQYETVMLERSLMKIGGLLQVGFGAAGADIIARNMGRGDMRLMEPVLIIN